MKAVLRTPFVTFEIEGNTPKELFKHLAETQEVFGEQQCGLCEGKNLRFAVRTVGKFTYHELVCNDTACQGKLTFGQNNDDTGRLFPVRKLMKDSKPDREKGTYGKHNGWTKYRGKQEGEAG